MKDRADNLRAIKAGTYRKGGAAPSKSKEEAENGEEKNDGAPSTKKGQLKMAKKQLEKMEQSGALALVDKAFYAQIWEASPHICQCGCKKKLPDEWSTGNFHHLLEKESYQHLRHIAENIMILAVECHTAYHNNPDNRPKIRKRREEVAKLLLG